MTIILGFPPGGASDAAMRIMQPILQAALGQPVVIDNRAGAGGNIGAQAVARAAADGHTIGSANIGTLAVNPALVRNMGFDPMTDLMPISTIFNAVNVLVCPANRPFRSVADIIAAATRRGPRRSATARAAWVRPGIFAVFCSTISPARAPCQCPIVVAGRKCWPLWRASMTSAFPPWARC